MTIECSLVQLAKPRMVCQEYNHNIAMIGA
jgi:hypothetical protein